MGLDLTNQYVDETYQKLIQLSGSNQLTDGTGSLVTDLDINVSTAVSSSFATTASYAENANVDSGSWDGQFEGDAGITGSLTVKVGEIQIGERRGIYIESGSYKTELDDRTLRISGDAASVILDATQSAAIIFRSPADSYIQKQGGGDFYFDNNSGNTILEGSGSVIVDQPLEANGGVTGSLRGNADTATSASYATTADTSISSSYALTASYALNAGGGDGFPYTGSADISGSLNVVGPITANNFGTISLTGDNPGVNRNIIDSTGADFTVIRSDSGLIIDNTAGTGSVVVYTNGNMQFEPQGDLDFYTPTGNINLTAAEAKLTATDGPIDVTLTDGDINSVLRLNKGTSNYNFGINQFPGFTGSILGVNGVDEFKVTGDVPLSLDNTGFGGNNDVSLRASNHVRLEAQNDIYLDAQDQVQITSNTTQDFQGIGINAPNVRINLSRTGSGAGDFALSAPGFGTDTPGMLLSLGTGSYGSNPTVANMLFTGDDAFFSAVGNFYIKNVFNDTGSITVWSESDLQLRGDDRVDITGDYFSTPGIRIPINLRGKTYADSIQTDIFGFSTVVNEIVYIDDNTRAFVETPLQVGGSGTITVTAGSTLKVINEL